MIRNMYTRLFEREVVIVDYVHTLEFDTAKSDVVDIHVSV